MKDNYDIKYNIDKSGSKQFLDYILETMVGYREPIKGIILSSEVNPIGTMANNLKGVLHKGAPKISVSKGMISLKTIMPLGISGVVNSIQLTSGDDETGQVVEVLDIPRIDKLDNVRIEVTVLLESYSA